MSRRAKIGAAEASAGAKPAPHGGFPELGLPIQPPFPPMEARSVREVPTGTGWQYEPKWDGFRCLAFRNAQQIVLQSKAGQTLGRYFPELLSALHMLPQRRFVLDGEIVIEHDGALHFDELLQRIHPAESRVQRLARETPARFIVFDLLVEERGQLLAGQSLSQRHIQLEDFLFKAKRASRLQVCPYTFSVSQAQRWMHELGGHGWDGVIAKRIDLPYRSGERDGMVKIKRLRTAECVVGGIRYARRSSGVGSLLLGLYDERGRLDHVGFCSNFNEAERKELLRVVKPLLGGGGFTGNAPGGPSRWSNKRSAEWIPLKPELVCEVQYDHFSARRFRHGTKFLRWRPEKGPQQCTFEQVTPERAPLKHVA